jgi:selenide, water dikinase
LVGTDTRDDAAVIKLDNGQAVVFTTDFFTPVVDDAFDFGRIAAANALSDVYAMGGTPLAALNIIGFPKDTLPLEILGDIMRGGASVCAEAGIFIVGGHSIDDAEPKYGLAVLGLVDPEKIWRNRGAKPGDVLLLTKPLGSGVITTAARKGVATEDDIAVATQLMTTLNKQAAKVAHSFPGAVHAATDVTGYGLLGHLFGMLENSTISARIQVTQVPVVSAARRLGEGGHFPGGTKANLRFVAPHTIFAEGVSEVDRLLIADAQTSGGLLLAVDPRAASSMRQAMNEQQVEAHIIGIFEVGEGKIFIE